MPELLRIGGKIVNLDNVMVIDLEWQDKDEDEPSVVMEFVMRGMDELDEGQNVTQPYLQIFEGAEAKAVRRYFMEKCPDLLKK